MAINERLLSILVCPETKLPVSVAPDDLLTRLNQQVSSGSLKNKSGKLVSEPLESGLLRQDKKRLYPIRHGIPIMLTEEAIEM